MIINPERLKETWNRYNEGAPQGVVDDEPSSDYNAGYIAGWHDAKKQISDLFNNLFDSDTGDRK